MTTSFTPSYSTLGGVTSSPSGQNPSLSVTNPAIVSYSCSSGSSTPNSPNTSSGSASPDTSYTPLPISTMSDFSSSYSSWILPMTASMMSSSVTIPAVPPYSSATTAIPDFRLVSDLNTSEHGHDSGTKFTSRIKSWISNESRVSRSFPTRHSRSLTMMIPTILSILSSYTGMRENPISSAR